MSTVLAMASACLLHKSVTASTDGKEQAVIFLIALVYQIAMDWAPAMEESIHQSVLIVRIIRWVLRASSRVSMVKNTLQTAWFVSVILVTVDWHVTSSALAEELVTRVSVSVTEGGRDQPAKP